MKTSENNSTVAKICANGFISLDMNENARNILIMGNTAGFFGYFRQTSEGIDLDESVTNMEKMNDRLAWIADTLENGAEFTIVGNKETAQYYQELFMFFKETDIQFSRNKQIRYKEINDDNECLQFVNKMNEKNMKFDYIIENPPYKGSLHLDFLKESLNMLDEKSGRFTIIEPATWLINVRKNGKAKVYDEIKQKLEGHVYKVVIENCNKEFNIGLYVPCSITYIDMSQKFDRIEFICCGAKKYISSLYDCNLVGEYDKIWSIFNKVQKFGDMMKDHIYNEKKSKVDENTWYTKYPEILGGLGASFCGSAQTTHVHGGYKFEGAYHVTNNGNIMGCYINTCWHHNGNEISNNLLVRYDSANKPTDKPADCLFDIKEHLENWKHFVFNNKLPLFLNICLTIDQNNNSKDFVPWLVDRQYTDDEINQLFGFTDDEITFMNRTIKKFERYSPWFKRYMCGKDSVTDEEVQKFIDNL